MSFALATKPQQADLEALAAQAQIKAGLLPFLVIVAVPGRQTVRQSILAKHSVDALLRVVELLYGNDDAAPRGLSISVKTLYVSERKAA